MDTFEIKDRFTPGTKRFHLNTRAARIPLIRVTAHRKLYLPAAVGLRTGPHLVAIHKVDWRVEDHLICGLDPGIDFQSSPQIARYADLVKIQPYRGSREPPACRFD